MAGGKGRTIDLDIAEKFREVLLDKDLTHSRSSAALSIGIHPKTVNENIRRFENEETHTDEDYEVGQHLACTIAMYAQALRNKITEEKLDSKSGHNHVNWWKWRLETQCPKEHPRNQNIELTGKDGGPLETTSTEALLELIRKTDENQ